MPLEQDSAKHIHAAAESEVCQEYLNLLDKERWNDIRTETTHQMQKREPQNLRHAKTNHIKNKGRAAVNRAHPCGKASTVGMARRAIGNREDVLPCIMEDKGITKSYMNSHP